MKKNQNGFGLLGVLVVVAVLAVIGFVGWKVWHDNKKTKTSTTTQTTTQKTNAPTTPATTQTGNVGTIDVQDWGIKVSSLHNSDMLQIKVYNTAGTFGESGDKYDGYAVPNFKSGVLKDDESCHPGLALYRSKTAFTSGVEQKKIGDHYYEITGGPGGCSNEADNALRTQFYKDFVLGNVSAM